MRRFFSQNISLVIAFSFALHAMKFAHATPTPTLIEVPEDHATIQAAVDAASSGTSILVGPGLYEESVSIDVDNIRLVAREGFGSVVIDGTGLGSVNGIHVTSDGVVLRDLIVQNFKEYVGPGVVDFRIGILIEGGSRCRVHGNLSRFNGDGIVFRGSSRCSVVGNISNNNIHNGIFLRNESDRNRVIDNRCLDNGPDMNPAPDFVPAGVGCGIQLSFDSRFNRLNRNVLSGNGRGLQFDRGATGNKTDANLSTGNSRFGVAALAVAGQPAASGNALRGNTVFSNGEFDLFDANFPPEVGNKWENNVFDTSNF